jgi:glycine cleavage system H protein
VSRRAASSTATEHREDAVSTPDDLRYTAEHEWVRTGAGSTVRVGITDYAQEALGDIVYVSLPEVGAEVSPGEALGEVESTKSVSDVYAPVPGTVSARNEVLGEQPELINTDPYGEGWLVEIDVSDPAALDTLLDAAGYHELLDEH